MGGPLGVLLVPEHFSAGPQKYGGVNQLVNKRGVAGPHLYCERGTILLLGYMT